MLDFDPNFKLNLVPRPSVSNLQVQLLLLLLKLQDEVELYWFPRFNTVAWVNILKGR